MPDARPETESESEAGPLTSTFISLSLGYTQRPIDSEVGIRPAFLTEFKGRRRPSDPAPAKYTDVEIKDALDLLNEHPSECHFKSKSLGVCVRILHGLRTRPWARYPKPLISYPRRKIGRGRDRERINFIRHCFDETCNCLLYDPKEYMQKVRDSNTLCQFLDFSF